MNASIRPFTQFFNSFGRIERLYSTVQSIFQFFRANRPPLFDRSIDFSILSGELNAPIRPFNRFFNSFGRIERLYSTVQSTFQFFRANRPPLFDRSIDFSILSGELNASIRPFNRFFTSFGRIAPLYSTVQSTFQFFRANRPPLFDRSIDFSILSGELNAPIRPFNRFFTSFGRIDPLYSTVQSIFQFFRANRPPLFDRSIDFSILSVE